MLFFARIRELHERLQGEAQAVGGNLHASVVLLQVDVELMQRDGFDVVHGQMRQIDFLRAQLKPFLDAALHAVVGLGGRAAFPIRRIHGQNIDPLDAFRRLRWQAARVAGVEQARVIGFNQVSVRARRMRYGKRGIAHAVEFMRIEWFKHVLVQGVIHVMELGVYLV